MVKEPSVFEPLKFYCNVVMSVEKISIIQLLIFFYSREYGEMALGILAICWQDSSLLAYNMLSKRHEDYNNKTVVEIAYDAEYIHFLAHPCCQKWLSKSFFGNMQVKELNWGIFRLPYWFKVSK